MKDTILTDCVPFRAPEGYKYEVECIKRDMYAIWLIHSYPYTYTNEVVKTIWGYYSSKKDQYYAPINSKKVGAPVDINDTTPYTAMQLNLNPLEQLLFT